MVIPVQNNLFHNIQEIKSLKPINNTEYLKKMLLLNFNHLIFKIY